MLAGKKTDTRPTDWHVPFPRPREQIADAKHFRSTWLTASQATLRERGLGDRYEAALDPRHRAAVLAAVAGVWLPMDVAAAHYNACDQLGLTDSELVEIGRAAMRRANATALSFMTRMAQSAGGFSAHPACTHNHCPCLVIALAPEPADCCPGKPAPGQQARPAKGPCS